MRLGVKSIAVLAVAVFLVWGCRKDDEDSSTSNTSTEDGMLAGSFTIYDDSPSAFSFPGTPVSNENDLRFYNGNSLFKKAWVAYGASTTARDGLGPTFNSNNCSGCHLMDGRGRAPEYFGEKSSGFLVRLSVPGMGSDGGPIPEPTYGGQLQNQSVMDSVPVEGEVRVTYQIQTGTYPDGTPYELQVPTYAFENLGFGPMSADVLTSPRVANQMIGLGLLEAISDNDILALADESDADGDGISGKPNYVWNIEQGRATLGRFGWKANQPNIKQQVAGAFHGDIGITSSLFPVNNCPDPQNVCANAIGDTALEIEDHTLSDVVLYSSVLGVPRQRDYNTTDVIEGKKLFKQIGCVKCHNDNYTTGIHPEIPELSGINIHPYTDMLLHDMGPGLADERPDYEANGNEWRTAPLWGIGLFNVVNNHTNYLHDGRARNVEEAILWHGGEAEQVKNQFMNLSASQRAQLITFLNSL